MPPAKSPAARLGGPGSGGAGLALPGQMSVFAVLANILATPAQGPGGGRLACWGDSCVEIPLLLGWDGGMSMDSPGLSSDVESVFPVQDMDWGLVPRWFNQPSSPSLFCLHLGAAGCED